MSIISSTIQLSPRGILMFSNGTDFPNNTSLISDMIDIPIGELYSNVFQCTSD